MTNGGEDFTGSITSLLGQVKAGDPAAREALMSRVYPELRRIAQSMISGQHRPVSGAGDGTGLVHDALCRLLDRERLSAEDRRHFFFLLGRAMKDVLAEQVRHDTAIKRGGDFKRVPLDPRVMGREDRLQDRLEVHEAIEKFRGIDPEGALVAELRCVHEQSLEATAEALGMTVPVVRRHWQYARAWLKNHLGGPGASGTFPDPDTRSET
ncbi:MAG: hypothetical protein KF787_13340 [Phycisphaeraceae bacterium]|nr:hypothetical protein [Phycisphaerae bacterium]MBX3393619.1 hypothetical protein [Phycisphaeraceae bacterium]HRJ50432.1 ECF-type sigma factor [Phycisphaerales bacterium]